MFPLLRLKRAIIALGWFVLSTSSGVVTAYEEEAVGGDDGVEDVPMTVIFVNEFPDLSIEVFWESHHAAEDDPNRRKFEGEVAPRGGRLSVETFLGHEFSYILPDGRHYVVPPPPNSVGEQFVILAGDSGGFRVRCELTTNSRQSTENLDILVKPYWAPRGANRFLELVRNGYYDGAALNRVVPQFLTQFGIARDYEMRTNLRENTILDDFDIGVKFEPGFISYAGSGPDSRTTEIFVVMPGTSQHQLDYFGENPWETPFAMVEGDIEESAIARIYSGYGDMPPWGSGPDSSKIYEIDGYDSYLEQNFPKLDYIERCYVVDEVGIDGDYSDGEF
mmetsp:Transcript_4731/g.10219  ORF Transcript_4731/g.10219 Transcript_4731/m.10219 type:complete len:334 (+) Transcript_4731:107-1108(+)